MKHNLIKKLRAVKKLSKREIRKNIFWLVIYSIAETLFIFKTSGVEAVIHLALVSIITFQLLTIGLWCGRYDILNVIYNGISESSENELSKNLITIIGGNINEK